MFISEPVQRQDDPNLRASVSNLPMHRLVLQLSEKDRSAFRLNISGILVRDDYIKSLNDICHYSTTGEFPLTTSAQNEFHNPFLDNLQDAGGGDCARNATVLGHPGIGKSLWLITVLVLRILAGRPTIFQFRPNGWFIFNNHGLYWADNISEPYSEHFYDAISPQYWCLVDCGRDLKEVPDVLASTQAFILQVASPRDEHLQWIKKYTKLSDKYYMKNWSLAELIIGRTLQPPSRQSSEKDLEIFSSHYAPSARMAYTYANKINIYDRLVQQDISKLTFESLGKMLSDAVSNSGGVSHHILLVNPAESDFTVIGQIESARVHRTITIPSHHMYTRLRKQLKIHMFEQAARLYDIFWRNDYTKAAASYIFEDIHNAFCKGGEWKLIPMSQNKPGINNTHFKYPAVTETKFMHLGCQDNILTIDDHPLTHMDPTPLSHHPYRKSIILADGYFQPPLGQPAYDSFIYDKSTQTATLLQMTVGGQHDFKNEGSKLLKEQGVKNMCLVVVKPPNPLDLAVPNSVVPWINKGVFALVLERLPL